MNRRRSSAEISKLVEEYQASGMSHLEFARLKGVPVSTASGWIRRRLAKGKQRTGSALVPVVPSANETKRDTGSVVRIDLACGRRVEVQSSIAPEILAGLLSVLDGRRC